MQRPTFSLASTLDIDPYPLYAKLREQGEVIWEPHMKGWLVLSYELCRHIEEREDLYRHPYADRTELLIEIKGGERNITVLQGEEHARLRRYLSRMFVPKAVRGYMEDHVQPILSYLMDRIAPKGRADLAYELADQLPPRVFISLLGLNWRDQTLVDRELELHTYVMDWIGGDRSEAATLRARTASHELNEVLRPQIRAAKEHPGNDLISRLWLEAPEVLQDVNEDDILAIGRELFLAGSDTSVHAIANALYLLLTNPDVFKAVASDREVALPMFIEESLRLLAVIQYRFRVANQDADLGGVNIRRNDLIIPVNAAGNRDPARYFCPHQIDLARKQPTTHLAFNLGPRTCIGAALARAELRTVVGTVLDQLPGIRLDPDAPPPHFAHLYARSFRPLHVLFDASSEFGPPLESRS